MYYMDRYLHFSSHNYLHYSGNHIYKENGRINEIALLHIKKIICHMCITLA